MTTLITGSAGNLGTLIARHMLDTGEKLHLMIHKNGLPPDISGHRNVKVFRADLGVRDSLVECCKGVDTVVHLGGVLFRPRPEKFLPVTNNLYFQNLVEVALFQGVKKIIMVGFPHVEGESTPDRRARGVSEGNPSSVHARTRLEQEKYLFRVTDGTGTAPVVFRLGMVYGRGILMIDAARWLARRRLLGVWRRPTWVHLISIPDFLDATKAAILRKNIRGIYQVGDDGPMTLQEFLDRAAKQWGCGKPWRMPGWMIKTAASSVELFASVFNTASPLTRDFLRIGMASYCMDTSRMRKELLPHLKYPTLKEGIGEL
jgi:nucleoside-diphosphate-sugar epimerase